MGAVITATITLCSCGEPAGSPVHGPHGHQFVPRDISDYLRPTQTYKRGYTEGHYSLEEARIVTVPQPPPGGGVRATVPGGTKWQVWSLRATLTTDAVANNRVPHLQITDGPNGHICMDFPAPQNQVAGTSIAYCAATSSVAVNFDNTTVIVLPVEVELLQGWVIGFSTTALDAGDQWSAMALIVTETLYF
jgi:hypothetical protein